MSRVLCKPSCGDICSRGLRPSLVRASMEIAKRPPPPPVETVKGYNPAMDQPRPTMIEDYLR